MEETVNEENNDTDEIPWYATRYGERALPDRGGSHLQHWELDMSPEAVARRERIATAMQKADEESDREVSALLEKWRKQNGIKD